MSASNTSFSPFQCPNNLTLLARCQVPSENNHASLLAGCNICPMDEELIRKVRSELAREGGQARAKALTAKERKAIATKASKAAAKARTRKAKERKAARTQSAFRPQ